MVPGNYTYAVAITPSNGTDIVQLGGNFAGSQPYCDAIFVGGAGIVALVLPDNTVQNFTCVAGEILPVRARRVNSTNTTATLMVALFYL